MTTIKLTQLLNVLGQIAIYTGGGEENWQVQRDIFDHPFAEKFIVSDGVTT
jgi:hypothetical protein